MPGTPSGASTRLRAEVTTRRPVEESTSEEMRKALAHLYDQVTVEVSGPQVRVEVDAADAATDLTRVVEHFLAGHREVPAVVVHDRRGPAARTPGADQPAPAREDRVPSGPGTFLQGPDWLADLRAVRELVGTRLTERFGVEAWQTPAMIDESVLVAAGYFAKFPHLVSTVHRLPPDYWDMVAVGSLAPNDDQGRRSKYLASGTALTPVTCYHVYAHAAELLAGRGSGLVHIHGPVFRHEGGNHGPTRLAEFTMTEIVGMGDVGRVDAYHRELLDTFIELMDELGVEFYVSTASDPFFGADANMLRAAQLMGAAKYEVRIPIPGEGDLSVASVNRHGPTFVSAFGLDSMGVEATCCAGIGLERLTYAARAHGRTPRRATSARA